MHKSLIIPPSCVVVSNSLHWWAEVRIFQAYEHSEHRLMLSRQIFQTQGGLIIWLLHYKLGKIRICDWISFEAEIGLSPWEETCYWTVLKWIFHIGPTFISEWQCILVPCVAESQLISQWLPAKSGAGLRYGPWVLIWVQMIDSLEGETTG